MEPEKNERSGFFALAGRPNVGKSTLLNSLLGQKIAIVSHKPQTTRRTIRGILSDGDWQMVFSDLPGFQKPLDALTKAMQDRVNDELQSTDGVIFVVNAHQGVGGAGDRFIAQALKRYGVPVTLVVNKIDSIKKGETVTALVAANDLGLDCPIFPISAKTGEGTEQLRKHLIDQLKPGHFWYGENDVTDLPLEIRISELIREQILQRMREELPHAAAVEVVEIEREKKLTTVIASIWVETASQKAIIIGARGHTVRGIGSGARKAIEAELGTKVFLDLSVKVHQHWRSEPTTIERLSPG